MEFLNERKTLICSRQFLLHRNFPKTHFGFRASVLIALKISAIVFLMISSQLLPQNWFLLNTSVASGLASSSSSKCLNFGPILLRVVDTIGLAVISLSFSVLFIAALV